MKLGHLLHAAVAACVAIAPMTARAEPPAAAAPLPEYVDLEVAQTVLEVDLVRSWASEAIGAGLGEAGVDAAKDGRRLAIVIGGAPFDYDLQVGVKDGGEWIGDMRAGKCKCDDEQLVARVRGDVVAVAGGLQPGETTGPVTPPIGPEVDPVNTDKRAPLGGKGKAGVALLVVGAGAVIAGAVVLALDAKEDVGSDDPSQLEGQNNKPAGAAVLAIGGVLVIVGATLLGLDRRDAKRKRSVAFAPAVGRRGFGIALSGRF